MASLAKLLYCESQTFGPQSGRTRTEVHDMFANSLNCISYAQIYRPLA